MIILQSQQTEESSNLIFPTALRKMDALLIAVVTVLLSASVLWPHTAYIHPDEFFQSTEIVAGDIFNITHLRSWEFQPEVPLRDISLTYLLYAPGFYLLRAVLQNAYLSQFVAESYAVLVLPRILLVMAGILNCAMIRKLCTEFSVDWAVARWYWCTSYVTWTFLTRSFSNTTETLLFSLVVMLLVSLVQGCRGAAGMKHDSPHKGVPRMRALSINSLMLGAVVCMGIFNRPTFLLFLAVPLIWCFDQLLCARLRFTSLVAVVCSASLGFLSLFVALSLANSLYYNPEFSHLLEDLYTSILRWDTDSLFFSAQNVLSGARVPLWNFLRYNLMSGNLAEHGWHPGYTHLVVNLPMLAGPCALLFYWDLVAMMRKVWVKQRADVLYASVICPMLFLSAFPHQEARFLLPVLPMLVVCIASSSVARWRTVQAITIIFNILGLVMFGWLHQGGVVPALSSLHSRIVSMSADPANINARYHVVSYLTYMPPRHLLFSDNSVNLHIDDMIGAHGHPLLLRQRMEQLHSECKRDHAPCYYFLLPPSTAASDVLSMKGWVVKVGGEFCPHLSLERPPVSRQMGGMEEVSHVLSQLCLKVLSVTM